MLLWGEEKKTPGLEQDATQRDPKCHSQSPEATDYVTSPVAIYRSSGTPSAAVGQHRSLLADLLSDLALN